MQSMAENMVSMNVSYIPMLGENLFFFFFCYFPLYNFFFLFSTRCDSSTNRFDTIFNHIHKHTQTHIYIFFFIFFFLRLWCYWMLIKSWHQTSTSNWMETKGKKNDEKQNTRELITRPWTFTLEHFATQNLWWIYQDGKE